MGGILELLMVSQNALDLQVVTLFLRPSYL